MTTTPHPRTRVLCTMGLAGVMNDLTPRFEADSGFALDLMVKDLSIALEVGRDTATPTPFAALCREMWASAAAMLEPGQDHTAIAKMTEQLAGTKLGGN